MDLLWKYLLFLSKNQHFHINRNCNTNEKIEKEALMVVFSKT